MTPGSGLGSESIDHCSSASVKRRVSLPSSPPVQFHADSRSGFCYIDPRDCAQGFRLALEKPLKGTHVFNIANADTAFTAPTAELVKRVFPNIPYKPDTSDPREGLISINKARDVLGFDPKYDWQSEVKKLQAGKA
jgi:nucleoside-diphosphate-sugar epimerase